MLIKWFKVLSPITGRVIGAKEVRVGNEKVSITRLAVQVVSGLQLTISPDSSIENGYIAETSVSRKLTAQYQEGLLDIELEWSDGTRTALRQVAVTDYYLLVDSLDPETVAFAPMVASHHPRVIAVGEGIQIIIPVILIIFIQSGSGELLRVALLTPEECRKGNKASRVPIGPLAETAAEVEVDFGAGESSGRNDFLQNDGHGAPGRDRRLKSDLADILRMNPIKDENNHEPTVQARQLHGNRHRGPAVMTPLEIGMYVLLAAFCFAIVVFVVSCVVYASKFKPEPPTKCVDDDRLTETRLLDPPGRDLTTDARDWVWLGRATLDRNPVHITDNPMANARAVPVEIVEDDPPKVDTSTFSKSASGRRYRLPEPWTEEEPQPPPVPPHAIPLEEATPPPRKHKHHHHHRKEARKRNC